MLNWPILPSVAAMPPLTMYLQLTFRKLQSKTNIFSDLAEIHSRILPRSLSLVMLERYLTLQTLFQGGLPVAGNKTTQKGKKSEFKNLVEGHFEAAATKEDVLIRRYPKC